MAKKKELPFWQSRKFIYVIIAAIVFVVLAVTKTVLFSPEQTMTFVLSLLGISVGGHAVTDIASIIAAAIGNQSEVPDGLGRGDGPSGPGDDNE